MSDLLDDAALPGGWTTATLDELGEWTGGGTPSKSNSTYWNGTIPWVSPKDMKTLVLDDTLDHITEEAVKDSAVKLFPADSIAFVVRSGILEHTLPVALIRVRATANQDLKVLTPSPGIRPRWLLHTLLAHAPDIRDRCQKDGTTVASLDFPKLKAYRLRVPPGPEQERIVEAIERKLQALERSDALLAEAAKRAKLLRRSMLNHAAAGQLVPQDPSDEPAKNLLGRDEGPLKG
jgi:type I restriction enzyme S subunit